MMIGEVVYDMEREGRSRSYEFATGISFMQRFETLLP